MGLQPTEARSVITSRDVDQNGQLGQACRAPRFVPCTLATMPRAFTLLASVPTPEGALELRQRGERDFMISIAGRVLMSSAIHRSEVAVAELGCGPIKGRTAPRVLIGGLGLGFTLRAALDSLPRSARVVVAELNPAVVDWCRGPLAVLTQDALADPRVEVYVGDVTEPIRQVAKDRSRPRFDAVVLDLYLGPSDVPRGQADPLYGRDILKRTHEALSPGGVYAVWGEDPNAAFERRLKDTGFRAELVRPQGGGPRHAVYVAVKKELPALGVGLRAEQRDGKRKGKAQSSDT